MERKVRRVSRSITLEDVAKRVGVSRMTVSAVLNKNTKYVRVSPDTQEKVLQAAAELEYFPNAIARSLRRKRTGIIGLYSAYGYMDVRLPFYTEILAGLQRACDLNGLALLVYGTFPKHSAKDIERKFLDGRIDGLLLHATQSDPIVPLLAKSSLPVVAIAEKLQEFLSVIADDEAGGKMQADHLAVRGHLNVLYRKTLLPHLSAENRYKGFIERARHLGINVFTWVGSEHLELGSREAYLFQKAIQEHDVTAIVCWNDMSAYDTLKFLRQTCASKDFYVVGYDGVQSVQNGQESITTIRAPWYEVANQAVTLLKALIENKDVYDTRKEVVLPVELITGGI
jgi:LacI family transcriptional regulator